MKIIKLRKKCSKKVRKVSQPPKKVSGCTDDPSKKPKKADGKKTAAKAGTTQPKKQPKTSEFVNTDSDESDDEQESQKASKGSDDEKELQNTSDNEQEPAVKCIVMHDDEQEPDPYQVKIPKHPDPAEIKIPRYCTHILTKGARINKSCNKNN